MGYSKMRTGRNGRPRYTACYLDSRGSLRSAGTFSSKKDADKAWQKAELRIGEGRLSDPRRGRQTFRRYVTEEWLPNHVMEASTRESYTYQLNKHILRWFGPMRMIDIMPSHVREWVTHLQAEGVTAATIEKVRFILSAIFTTALEEVTFLHPCKGIKTPTVPSKPLRIITPEQFDVIYDALPDDVSRLLVETDIEAGLRWGELTGLRVRDLDLTTRILTVSRAVVQVDPKFHPEGKRFLIKNYPKDKEYRCLKLSQQLCDKIVTRIRNAGLGADDLIFGMPHELSPAARLRVMPDRATLGLTKPNAAGRQYWHGTMSGYNAGRCRCTYCKDAAAVYRATRRAAGEDSPRRPRTVDTDGHIPRDWFRNSVWKPALKRAEITFHVRPHDLRHAHTLPDADDTALGAFSKIRNRTARRTA